MQEKLLFSGGHPISGLTQRISALPRGGQCLVGPRHSEFHQPVSLLIGAHFSPQSDLTFSEEVEAYWGVQIFLNRRPYLGRGSVVVADWALMDEVRVLVCFSTSYFSLALMAASIVKANKAATNNISAVV